MSYIEKGEFMRIKFYFLKQALLTVFLFSCAFCSQAVFAAADVFSPRDGAESFRNPDCGPFGARWIRLKQDGNKPVESFDRHMNFCFMWELSRFSAGNKYRDKEIPTNRVGGVDLPLSDDALDAVDKSLAAARAHGVTVYVRLGYTYDEAVGTEPGDFKMILKHQEQIGAVISRYPDVVTAVECGLLGPWGEMHSSAYGSTEYVAAIVRKWLDVTPPSVAILVRAPNHILDYAGAETTDAYFAPRKKKPGEERIGMYNDGYLGTDWDYGTWADGGKRYFSRAQGVNFLETRPAGPYGGECAYVSMDGAKKVKILYPENYNIVQEFYRTHLSFLRNIRQKISLIEYLDSITFKPETYSFTNMPALAEYDGKSLRKFIDDHLGYRYVVRKMKKPAPLRPGKPFNLSLLVENTGFAQARVKGRAQLVFQQGDKTFVADAKLSTPMTDWKSGACTTVRVTGKVPKELKRGDCTVALRLRVPMKDEKKSELPRRPIRFANEGMWCDDIRANALATVKVK